jgi:hypothetical protein
LTRSTPELGGELAEHGEIGNGRSVRDGDTNSKKDNDATYVVARLNRDRPEPEISLPVVEDSSCRVRLSAIG